MTITGTYPTDSNSQKTYIDGVHEAFKKIESQSNLVAVHGTNAPTDSALQAKWSSLVPYAPPTNGSRLVWFNPSTGRVEQVYYPIAGSAGVLAPYKAKPSNSGLEFIAEQTIETPAILDISGISQAYRHLLITWSGRGAQAGSGSCVLGIRFNNISTTSYDSEQAIIQSGGNPATSGATHVGATYGFLTTGEETGATQQSLSVSGHIFIPNYSISMSSFGRRHYFARGTSVFSNTRPYSKAAVKVWGQSSVTAAITRIQILDITNSPNALERGSKMIIYGLK